MTGADIAARAARQAVIPQASGADRAFSGFFRALMYGAIGVSLLALVTLLYDVARDGLPNLSWDFLTSFPSRIIPANSGVESAIYGTLYLTAIGLIVAIPVGILSGIYLSEFARPRVRKVIKPILEVLAGVPTIVFGYFALTFFTPEVLRNALGIDVNQFNALSAGIILGILVIPTIATLVEDAMSAVPQSLREGSAGLGANKVQTAIRIVFPAALSGVVAALVLGASRAIGETVIILIAGGQQPNLSINPTESYQSMAAFIAATSRGDIPTGSIEYETIFVVGMTLFVLTLTLNLFSIRLVRKYRQVYE